MSQQYASVSDKQTQPSFFPFALILISCIHIATVLISASFFDFVVFDLHQISSLKNKILSITNEFIHNNRTYELMQILNRSRQLLGVVANLFVLC